MTPWKYSRKEINSLEDIPQGVFGFVYIITKKTGEYYIGRKNLFSTKKLPPLKGQRRKRTVTQESNWKTYMSSNKQVQKWDECEREILHWAYNKKQLTYYENKALYSFGVLEDEYSYNANIAGRFFKEEFINISQH